MRTRQSLTAVECQQIRDEIGKLRSEEEHEMALEHWGKSIGIGCMHHCYELAVGREYEKWPRGKGLADLFRGFNANLEPRTVPGQVDRQCYCFSRQVLMPSECIHAPVHLGGKPWPVRLKPEMCQMCAVCVRCHKTLGWGVVVVKCGLLLQVMRSLQSPGHFNRRLSLMQARMCKRVAQDQPSCDCLPAGLRQAQQWKH